MRQVRTIGVVIIAVSALLASCSSSPSNGPAKSSSPTPAASTPSTQTAPVEPSYAPLTSVVANAPGQTLPFGGEVASQGDAIAAGVRDVAAYTPVQPGNPAKTGYRAVAFTVLYVNNTAKPFPINLFTSSLTVDGAAQDPVIDKNYVAVPNDTVPVRNELTYHYNFYVPDAATTATFTLETVVFKFVFSGMLPS